jgi:hypothetical protein
MYTATSAQWNASTDNQLVDKPLSLKKKKKKLLSD